MYVTLYPNKKLKQAKQAMTWGGLFLLCGGLVALANEVAVQEQVRWGRLTAAILISTFGALWIALGTGKLYLKDAYFSMTPERISYRLKVYGPERVIYWQSIDSIQATEHTILFELKNGEQVVMRLGSIQCSRTANHVSVSIQLAAMEQNVEVNGVAASSYKVN